MKTQAEVEAALKIIQGVITENSSSSDAAAGLESMAAAAMAEALKWVLDPASDTLLGDKRR